MSNTTKKRDRQLLTGIIVTILSGAVALLGQVIDLPLDTSWGNDGVLTLSELFAFLGMTLISVSDRVKGIFSRIKNSFSTSK